MEPSEDFDRVYQRYARRCAESAIDPLGYSDAWSVVRTLLEALRPDVTTGDGDRTSQPAPEGDGRAATAAARALARPHARA